MEAVANGYLKFTEKLLEAGAEIEKQDGVRIFSTIFFIESNRNLLFLFDTNMTQFGRTALSHAACGGHFVVGAALLRAGAVLDHRDKVE